MAGTEGANPIHHKMWMKLSGIRTLDLYSLERRIQFWIAAPMGQAVQ